MKEKIFLGIGGNIGDVKKTFDNVFSAIQNTPGISNFSRSQCYRTKAESDIDQPDFLNCVVQFSSDLNPNNLFSILEEIERSQGKVKKPKNAPRKIDIDILLYGSRYVVTKDLLIPHPHFLNRLFVLVPFLDFQEQVVFPKQDGSVELVDIREQIKKAKKNCDYYPCKVEV